MIDIVGMRTKELWVPEKKTRPVSVTSGTSLIVDEVDKQWFASSQKCDLHDLQKLLKKDGELVNKKDYFTACIHWAVKYGRTDIIHWLVQQNADINIRTGYSPHHIATQHKQEAIVYKLVHDYKCDIDIRDYSGRKARHYNSSDAPLIEDEEPKLRKKSPGSNTKTNTLNRPLSLVRSLSMSQISSVLSEDPRKKNGHHGDDEINRKKKRGLSLTNSFINKGKKKFTPKKMSRYDSFADRTPKLSKSPSLPDLYGNPFELPDRRESLILYGFDSNSLLINGYATFINKNKYHRRTSTCPSINNDDLSVSQKSYRAIEKHAQWQANTYV